MNDATILIVDDNAENLYILRVLLRAEGYTVHSANHGAEALKLAREHRPNLVVSDILMPVMDGFSLCREWMIDNSLKHIPFIFYTATYTDDRDRDFALSLGATRFIVKPEEPEILVGIIRETLQESGTEASPITEQQMEQIAHSVPEESVYLKQYNEALIRKLENKMEQLERTNQALKEDITRREVAERRLFMANEFLDRIIEYIPHMVFLKDAGTLQYVRINRAVELLLGRDRSEVEGKSDYDFFSKELADSLTAIDRQVLQSGEPVTIPEESLVNGRGEPCFLSTRKVPILNREGTPEYLLGISEDITQQKAAQKERQELEMQLIQAQKMESIGRLAGGVAHDFNNKLFIIMSHAELLLDDLPADSPIREDLTKIFEVAQSSADLTRQLLAFARRQAVSPKVVDLDQTIGSIVSMLTRILKTGIEMKWQAGDNGVRLQMDPSQLDQLLANLVVNARDAIGDKGGVIQIETGHSVFDAEYCAEHIGYLPGEYAVVTVSDTGCGMDQETQAQVFEPFFTTKAPGEGTGLGLATVYGIVKQNNGFLLLESELNRGTTFRVFLPAMKGGRRGTTPAWTTEKPTSEGERETILVVEDDSAILALAKKILERLNYKVLAAQTPGAAIDIAKQQAGTIHLLITDIMMPGMNGRELVAELKKHQPDMRHLYMSGYASLEVVQRAVVEERAPFLQKPFSIPQLASKVREVLQQEL